jgi:hypothetical protein
MKVVLLVLVITTATHAFAFRPALAGTSLFWLSLLVPYALLALLALQHLRKEGALLARLGPRWGDLSMGVGLTAVLLVITWIGRGVLTPPGTERQAWLLRLYLQMGDPDVLQRSIWMTAILLLLPVLEELVWRGFLLDLLAERFGARGAWPLAALLYAASFLPAVFLLSDPHAGPNPLLPLVALLGGLSWSFLAVKTKRLAPVMLSHMAFTYFSAVQFRVL